MSVNSSVSASVTSLLGFNSLVFLVGGSELLMKLAMASMDSKSSSFSRSESISSSLFSPLTPEVAAGLEFCLGDSVDLTLTVVSLAESALMIVPFTLGGVEILVGSRTGMILLLAVIFTSRELGAGLALTGVMTSLGGGVLGLGGLMLTFTSMGACWLEMSGLVSALTQNPARAVRQLLSVQARSATACR